MSNARSAVLVAAILAGLPLTANAEFRTFYDEASYLDAVGSLGASDFTATESSSLMPTAPSSGGEAVSSGASLLGTYWGPRQEFVSGSRPMTIFGAYFTNLTPGLIIASLDGTPFAAFESFIGDPGFFGVVSDGFHSISFESNWLTLWFAHDVTIAHADAVVPEPASASLFGMGVLGLLGFGVRRRRKSASLAA